MNTDDVKRFTHAASHKKNAKIQTMPNFRARDFYRKFQSSFFSRLLAKLSLTLTGERKAVICLNKQHMNVFFALCSRSETSGQPENTVSGKPDEPGAVNRAWQRLTSFMSDDRLKERLTDPDPS